MLARAILQIEVRLVHRLRRLFAATYCQQAPLRALGHHLLSDHLAFLHSYPTPN